MLSVSTQSGMGRKYENVRFCEIIRFLQKNFWKEIEKLIEKSNFEKKNFFLKFEFRTILTVFQKKIKKKTYLYMIFFENDIF